MRVLGLDVGSKTIGVAVSDPLGLTAQGVTVIRRASLAADLAELKSIIAEYGAERIIVGMPLSLSGAAGPQAQRTEKFIGYLKKAIDLPVETIDERYSTAVASQALIAGGMAAEKRKQIIDQQAAMLILQTYLERQRHRRDRQDEEPPLP